MPNCAPLWFLPCLFLSTMYIYFFLKLSRKLKIVFTVIGLIIIYVFSYYSIVQLPWHLDIAFIGMLFMCAGLLIKKYNIYKKMSSEIVFILLFIGGYIVFTNKTVDLNSRTLNNIYLTFSSAIILSLIIIFFFSKYNITNNVLKMLGKYSIFAIAFNSAINAYSHAIWFKIPIVKSFPFTWYVDSLINIVVLMGLIEIYKIMRKKYPKISIVIGK